MPETRYAVNRGVHIAYQALGEGPPDYPAGMPQEAFEQIVEVAKAGWGTAAVLPLLAPSAADVRALLPTLRVPTLVLHRAGDQFAAVVHGRYLADHIPAARYVELPGRAHPHFVGDTDAVLTEVEEFVTGRVARHDGSAGGVESLPGGGLTFTYGPRPEPVAVCPAGVTR